MKIRVISEFYDKFHTSTLFKVGTVLDFEESRAKDVIARKLAVPEEPKVAKAPKAEKKAETEVKPKVETKPEVKTEEKKVETKTEEKTDAKAEEKTEEKGKARK